MALELINVDAVPLPPSVAVLGEDNRVVEVLTPAQARERAAQHDEMARQLRAAACSVERQQAALASPRVPASKRAGRRRCE